MAADTTTRSPTVDEITGSVAVPPRGYLQQPMQDPPIVTKENLAKLFFWALPIVFTAGALFVSVTSMNARQDAQERSLQVEKDRGSRLEADQRVMQNSVQTISDQQDKLVNKVESIDEKLNEQRADLRAIGERLGARLSSGGTTRMSEPNP